MKSTTCAANGAARATSPSRALQPPLGRNVRARSGSSAASLPVVDPRAPGPRAQIVHTACQHNMCARSDLARTPSARGAATPRSVSQPRDGPRDRRLPDPVGAACPTGISVATVEQVGTAKGIGDAEGWFETCEPRSSLGMAHRTLRSGGVWQEPGGRSGARPDASGWRQPRRWRSRRWRSRRDAPRRRRRRLWAVSA